MNERPICDQSRRMLLLFPTESHRNSVISSRLPTRCLKSMPFWHRPFPNYQQRETSSPDFSGLEGVEGTRFHREIERLGEFLVEYVISGELDRIYAETAN